jgi:hypothetical protein
MAKNEGQGDVAGEMVARLGRWLEKPVIGDDIKAKQEVQRRVEARRKHERPLPKVGDGRRLRATGRTEQFNIKVKPAWREEIQALARDRDIGMAELLERMLVEWKSLGGKATG